MRTIRFGMLALLAAVCAISQTNAAGSDRQRLIGAWRLISMSGPDGKPVTTGGPRGLLIYTGDGHMSVQLMYPDTAKSLSNEYVRNGYEASFGRYDINGSTHIVTHHVEGANTGGVLVGKDLARAYRFGGGGRLFIRSAREDEHWSVVWEHY